MSYDPSKAWDPVARLVNINRNVVSNYSGFVQALSEILEHGYWREFLVRGSGEIKSFQRFEDFLTWCECPADELKAVLRVHGDEPLLAQVLAELGGDLAQHGEIGGGHASRVSDTNSGSKKPDATYILARLRRDHPELAEKVLAGELTANAAAILAGFRKRYIRVPAGDPAGAVSKLLTEYTRDELTRELQVA